MLDSKISKRKEKFMVLIPIECHGIGKDGQEILAKPVKLNIVIRKNPDGNEISVNPKKCRHNTGGHGQRCKASHPYIDKGGEDFFCPYAFDYPYAKESEGWKMPEKIKEAIRMFKLLSK
jgi:hypothetical protein